MCLILALPVLAATEQPAGTVRTVCPSASTLPWADGVIHTNPVLERGLGPEMVTPGYTIKNLTAIGRDGEPVIFYAAWMQGRSGEIVWVKFRPGEAVEAKCTGVRTITQNNKRFRVETWEAKRVVRCGNPTSIAFYCWVAEATTIRGPEGPQGPPGQTCTPVTNIYNYTFTPSVYPSAQMLGPMAPIITTTQLGGVCWVQPTRINVSSWAFAKSNAEASQWQTQWQQQTQTQNQDQTTQINGGPDCP